MWVLLAVLGVVWAIVILDVLFILLFDAAMKAIHEYDEKGR